MTKVVMMPAEAAGGTRFYRMTEPARVLAERYDYQIEIRTDLDVDADRDARTGMVDLRSADLRGADLLVLHRPLSQQMHQLAGFLRQCGVPFVVDIDDDFHNVHPGNVAARAVDPRIDRLHNRDWLRRTCAMADVVTVSTPSLAKYAASPTRAVVVRNRVPERIFDTRLRGTLPVAIGWTGTTRTHPNDLPATRGALADLAQPVVVVGDRAGVARGLGIAEDRVIEVPWTDTVEQYWQAIADHITIGIVPLEVSKFNRAKSALKGLEFAALGVPFVNSPLPEYTGLNRLGAGQMATSRTKWRNLLTDSSERRDELGRRGRLAAEQLTIESGVNEWHRAWQLALGSRWTNE